MDELVSLQKDFYAALSPWFYAKVGAKDPEKVSFPRYDNFAESEQKKAVQFLVSIVSCNTDGVIFFRSQSCSKL